MCVCVSTIQTTPTIREAPSSPGVRTRGNRPHVSAAHRSAGVASPPFSADRTLLRKTSALHSTRASCCLCRGVNAFVERRVGQVGGARFLIVERKVGTHLPKAFGISVDLLQLGFACVQSSVCGHEGMSARNVQYGAITYCSFRLAISSSCFFI